MSSLNALFTWQLPLVLFVAEWLAGGFVECVNSYRRHKRKERLKATVTLLSDPWPSEPVELKSIDEFVGKAIERLRPLQHQQRLERLNVES